MSSMPMVSFEHQFHKPGPAKVKRKAAESGGEDVSVEESAVKSPVRQKEGRAVC